MRVTVQQRTRRSWYCSEFHYVLLQLSPQWSHSIFHRCCYCTYSSYLYLCLVASSDAYMYMWATNHLSSFRHISAAVPRARRLHIFPEINFPCISGSPCSSAALRCPLSCLSGDALIIALHWLPIKQCIHFKIATVTYRILQTGSPAYLSPIINLNTPSRTLRSASHNFLYVPFTNTAVGRKAFRYAAPTV